MKNWRTTLVGTVCAIGYAGFKLFKTGNITMEDIAIIAGLAGVGFVAKDAGVSGTEK